MDEVSDVSFSKVRDLIFAFERQSSIIEAPESGPYSRQRAKSTGNGLSYKQFRQPNLEIHSLLDIEKELVKIEAHLNYYEVYEKETHVAFQEQLFNILISIVSIDAEGQENTIQKKKDLIVDTSRLARILNSKLPFEGTHSHKILRRTYSNVVRRDEAVVSTTSRSRTVNGGYKSEESLNSTKDSVDLSVSSKQDDVNSVDLNRPESASPILEKQEVIAGETTFLPSVSRLKKFFSFKRDEKPEIRVSSASYSGLSRSQSLNLKNNSYVVTKRERVADKLKEESIDEDGSAEEETDLVEANSHVEVYNEPIKEIEEYREIEEIEKMNISVSKLKSLFEDRQKENDEGLGLITKKQTQLMSGFSLPYTEANLGAFRLKRTISGNYLNCTGLGVLRNVDIKTKSEISKSKSLSDLKSESFHYSYKDDLSNEIDENENINGNATYYNQDFTKDNSGNETYQDEEEEDSGQQPESLTFNKVELLKKSFESFNNSVNTSVQKNEDSRPVLTLSEQLSGPESVLQEQLSVLEEPSFVRVTNETAESDEEKEEAKVVVASGTVETLKHTFEHLSSTISEKAEATVPMKPEETLKDIDDKREEVLVSAESVQDLRNTFESLSRSNSQEKNIPVEDLKADKEWKGTSATIIASHSSTMVIEHQSSSTIGEKTVPTETITPEENVKATDDSKREEILVSAESVQNLKKAFESLSRSNSRDQNTPTEVLKTLIAPVPSRRTTLKVEYHSSSTTSPEQTEEEVPSKPEETPNDTNKSSQEAVKLTESVQELKKSNEGLSRSNSKEPNPETVETLKTVVVPISSHSSAVTMQHTHTEHSAVTSTTTEESKNSYTVELEPPSQEVPSKIIIQNNTIEFDTNAGENGGSAVPISLYNGKQTADSSENIAQNSFARAEIENKTANITKILEAPVAYSTITDSSESITQNSLARAEIENKTANLMKILEAPVAYSTITGESYSHASAVSQLQTAFSEIAFSSHSNNLSIENTMSVEPVQEKLLLVSSEETLSEGSTTKFSQSFEAKSYSESVAISNQPDTTTYETTTAQIENDSQEDHFHFTLSTSQENILDEILNDGVPNDINEQFEKLLHQD